MGTLIYFIDHLFMNKLYIYSRKVHRLLVIFVTVFGLIMSVTGTLMKFHLADSSLYSLHDFCSLIFTGVFGLMLLTGLYLYIFPYLKKGRSS